MAAQSNKIPYDPAAPDMRLLRLAVFERLRLERDWRHMPKSGHEFHPYIEFVQPDRMDSLAFHVREVMWQLLCEGVLAPGFNSSNLELPWFHLTPLGRSILDTGAPNPFDPEGYIQLVKRRVPRSDDTVLAYLAESLNAQRHGVLAASTVMLGIAAERVFLLVCDSLLAALADSHEQEVFEKLLKQFPMKPKLDWVRNKVERIQASKIERFPDNASLVVVAMYDLMRSQRNELGHPRDTPPNLTREDVLGNLQIFVRYYETAEVIREVLGMNRV